MHTYQYKLQSCAKQHDFRVRRRTIARCFRDLKSHFAIFALLHTTHLTLDSAHCSPVQNKVVQSVECIAEPPHTVAKSSNHTLPFLLCCTLHTEDCSPVQRVEWVAKPPHVVAKSSSHTLQFSPPSGRRGDNQGKLALRVSVLCKSCAGYSVLCAVAVCSVQCAHRVL